MQLSLSIDPGACLPGRGAYCHLTKRCLADRKTFERLVSTLSRALKNKQADGLNRVVESGLIEVVEKSFGVVRKNVLKEKLVKVKEFLNNENIQLKTNFRLSQKRQIRF